MLLTLINQISAPFVAEQHSMATNGIVEYIEPMIDLLRRPEATTRPLGNTVLVLNQVSPEEIGLGFLATLRIISEWMSDKWMEERYEALATMNSEEIATYTGSYVADEATRRLEMKRILVSLDGGPFQGFIISLEAIFPGFLIGACLLIGTLQLPEKDTRAITTS